MLSWPWVAGWLHTEISVRRREFIPEVEILCVIVFYAFAGDYPVAARSWSLCL